MRVVSALYTGLLMIVTVSLPILALWVIVQMFRGPDIPVDTGGALVIMFFGVIIAYLVLGSVWELAFDALVRKWRNYCATKKPCRHQSNREETERTLH